MDVSSFQELKAKLYLKKPVRAAIGQIICAFSKPTNNISFEPLNVSQNIPWSRIETSLHKDSIHFWFAGVTGDSLKLKVLDNNKILDTIEVKITVNSDATMLFEPLFPKDSVTYDKIKIDSIIRARLIDLPKINPALKRGIPVKTQFILPVILKVE